MNGPYVLETIPCPYCGSECHHSWAEEAGFTAVRCETCSLIYCNRRLPLAAINSAVRTGIHGEAAHRLDVRARRVGRKVRYYRRALGVLFAAVWGRGRPVFYLGLVTSFRLVSVGDAYGTLRAVLRRAA